MISSKKLPGLVAWLLVLALAAAFIVPSVCGTEDGMTMPYEETIFGQELLTVDIVMDEADWDSLLQNAISEEYQNATVVVGNKKYTNVGIRCKGNTSLSQVASSDSDRYSFKIKFDEYNTGETADGLGMLVLNNLMSDASYLKEYLTYDMFRYLGADASLCTMARVTVNGEPWGIYQALEQVDENMLLREYGSVGELYKPDLMGMGGDRGEMPDGGNFGMPEGAGNAHAMPGQGGRNQMGGFSPDADAFRSMLEQFGLDETELREQLAANGIDYDEMLSEIEAGTFDFTRIMELIRSGALEIDFGDRGGMGGGFGMSGGGSTLNYTDDSLDSYSSIWNGAKTDSTDADHRRVVEALKGISEGDLETYMDVDNMLRYMAVQTFVVNLDSLTGSMAHNYYLYEDNGRLNLIPWDYNLAFGGFQTGNASETINFPIDTPFTASMEDRQFFAALLENEEYLAQYHAYLRDLCEGYVGKIFPQTYAAMRLLLDDLVASEGADPTSFYTNEEYLEAVEMLRTVMELRAQSILGQLDGSIPSTSDGQDAAPDRLLDCSAVDLSVMGSQFGGGNRGGFGMPQGMPAPQGGGMGMPREMPAGETAPTGAEATEMPRGGGFGMPAGMNVPDTTNAPSTAAPTGSFLSGGAAENNLHDPAAGLPTANTDPAVGAAGSQAADGSMQRGDRQQMENGGQPPNGMSVADRSQSNTGSLTVNLLVTCGVLAVLVLAMLIARVYHRRKFRTK